MDNIKLIIYVCVPEFTEKRQRTENAEYLEWWGIEIEVFDLCYIFATQSVCGLWTCSNISGDLVSGNAESQAPHTPDQPESTF